LSPSQRPQPRIEDALSLQRTASVSATATPELDRVQHIAHTTAIIQDLVDAVATGDRDRIFAKAKRLVDGTPVVVEQTTRPEDRWMTVEEVAGQANVCRMTVWRWRNEQGLKFTKVGNVVRVRQSELDGFLKRHMQG
jgi:excisionase family DNA binding protein